MLHSTRFLNKLNKSIHMYLIPTSNPGQILGLPGLFGFSVMLSTPVADFNLIGPLGYKWDIVAQLTLANNKQYLRRLANFFLKMLNSIILAILSVPSILAALSSEVMASALIAAEDTVTLEQTFKTFEKEQDVFDLSFALLEVAKVQTRMPKVVDCLRMVHDSFPKDRMCVSELVYRTLSSISCRTDAESFANLITSFKPSDIKPLVAIRYMTFTRDDALDVLKKIMKKSPEMITHDLPSWLASHKFDPNSTYYSSLIEEPFQYLTSFAVQSVLEKALSILKRNEHYILAYTNGHAKTLCCKSHDSIPQDLFNKLNTLLKLVKVRNARIKGTLIFLPRVLVDLVLDYAHMTMSEYSTSNTETSVSVLGKRSSRLQSRTSHKKSKRGQ